jgi:putative DNA primase/helicase
MAIDWFEINAPPEILAALERGKRCSFGIEAVCPKCGRGPRDRKLRAGILRSGPLAGKMWWDCMRCRCKKDYSTAQRTARLRMRFDAAQAKADDKRSREQALSIWECTSAIRPADPVDRYLREQRSLRPFFGETWPVDLRWGRLEYWDDDGNLRVYDGMVAAVRDSAGNFMGIHRTYLLPDGRRIDGKDVPRHFWRKQAKKAKGPIFGGAIRLGPDADTVGVGEGIESALGFAMRLGHTCWATVSAKGMRALVVPKSICKIVIGPDIGDKDDAGFDAALHLQQRMRIQAQRGRVIDAELLLPPLCEKGDWADWAKNQTR